jgi:uncharacterized protein (DUF1330 family)
MDGRSREYQGGCHCGRVRFQARGELTGITACNCSICQKKGFLHWIIPRDAFELRAGQADLTTYRFNTGVAQHMFCNSCGIHSFYVPRSDPDKIDVNVRCLDGVDPGSVAIAAFDGQNWEAAMAGHVPWRARGGESPSEAAGFVLVAILGVRRAALAQFHAYETRAAAIMRRYGGAIARTVAIAPGPDAALIKEVHVVTFPSADAFAAYRQDAELAEAAPLRDAAIASTEILIGSDGPRYG